MVDFPWYMGMAPLLGWCLDAVVASRRFDTLVPRAIEQVAVRLVFVLRQAFPNQPARGGWVLTAWVGGAAWLLGWALTSGAWVLAGPFVAFAAWTAVFFLAFSMRSKAGAALRIQRALETENIENAQAWLRFMGEDSESTDPEVVAGTAVKQTARSIAESAMLPLFWGLFLGAGGALAALALHELANQADERTDEDDLWGPVLQVGNAVVTAPCWVALFFIQATIQFSGGSRGPTMAGFLNRFRETPPNRVAAAVAYGLNLGPSAGGHEDAPAVSPRDVQRATVLLWTSSGLAAAFVAAAGCLLYHFIL